MHLWIIALPLYYYEYILKGGTIILVKMFFKIFSFSSLQTKVFIFFFFNGIP